MWVVEPNNEGKLNKWVNEWYQKNNCSMKTLTKCIYPKLAASVDESSNIIMQIRYYTTLSFRLQCWLHLAVDLWNGVQDENNGLQRTLNEQQHALFAGCFVIYQSQETRKKKIKKIGTQVGVFSLMISLHRDSI